jgi:hypothetical protein
LDDVAGSGPRRYCLSSHMMPFNSFKMPVDDVAGILIATCR